ncbi:MAG: hypothetical protein NE327_09470 [Lentisphaeraceae bacterium]|nr:hypothetical protein [Lentisphaeraceae bacterium]
MELFIAILGIIITILSIVIPRFKSKKDTDIIYNWLVSNSSETQKFRSGKAISSATNIPIDRVRKLCSISPNIRLSTGEKDDMWTVLK